MSKKILTILKEIKAIHEKVVPVQVKDKIKPATDSQIAPIEKVINGKLPADFITFLQTNDFRINFNGNFESLTAKQSLEKLKSMNQLLAKGTFDDGRVEDHEERGFGNWKGDYLKKVWWSPKWVPFAVDGCGNMKCIDLDPGKNGTKGQIMAMEIQEGQGPFADQAESFRDYLEYQLELLQEKRYSLAEYGDNEFRLIIDRYNKYEE
jgi:cell wall assembly regulator SMI1